MARARKMTDEEVDLVKRYGVCTKCGGPREGLKIARGFQVTIVLECKDCGETVE